MALSPPLSPLEKRTATLLTIIGILGSLLGITGIAFPYYLFFGVPTPFNWCEYCTNTDDLVRRTEAITLIIIILSIMVSFLPRIIYGITLRKGRQERERSSFAR